MSVHPPYGVLPMVCAAKRGICAVLKSPIQGSTKMAPPLYQLVLLYAPWNGIELEPHILTQRAQALTCRIKRERSCWKSEIWKLTASTLSDCGRELICARSYCFGGVSSTIPICLTLKIVTNNYPSSYIVFVILSKNMFGT